MKCPKCSGILERKKLEGEDVDVCWVCEGIWLDRNELEHILIKDNLTFIKPDLNQDCFDGFEVSHLDLNNKVGICPKCNHKMKHVLYKNKILIDICPDNHGLWLDGGEVLKLRKKGIIKFFNIFRSIFLSIFK